jgi:hypothetical protein
MHLLELREADSQSEYHDIYQALPQHTMREPSERPRASLCPSILGDQYWKKENTSQCRDEAERPSSCLDHTVAPEGDRQVSDRALAVSGFHDFDPPSSANLTETNGVGKRWR